MPETPHGGEAVASWPDQTDAILAGPMLAVWPCYTSVSTGAGESGNSAPRLTRLGS
jgi:hypothetical protein